MKPQKASEITAIQAQTTSASSIPRIFGLSCEWGISIIFIIDRLNNMYYTIHIKYGSLSMIVKILTKFARAAAKLTGAISIDDFVDAVQRECPSLQSQTPRFPTTQGSMAHTVFFGDKVAKGPLWKNRIMARVSRDIEYLQQLEGAGLPVIPKVIYVGQKETKFFLMSLMPGVTLASIIKTLTKEEKRNLAKDIAGILIDMALAMPQQYDRYARPGDLQPGNILIYPETKRLSGIIDFGFFQYRPWNKLGHLPFRTRASYGMSGFGKMVRQEFDLRKAEMPDSQEVHDHSRILSGYAEKCASYSRLGAIFALAGFDVERWWKSVKNEKWDNHMPPTAAAPDIDALRAEPLPAERRRVLVTGATGFIGPAIVQELLAAGHDVVCAVRSPERAQRDLPYPGIEFIQVDMNVDTDPEQWVQRLREYKINTVVNNAGIEMNFGDQDIFNINLRTPLAIAKACRTLQRESGEMMRFIQISTAVLTATDCDAFDYARSKRGVEEGLSQMTDLDWISVRPNYIYEPRRGHALFEELVKLPALAFVDDGAKQPISNRDLALGIANLVTSGDGASQCILDAAGTESLTWRDMLRHVSVAMHEDLRYTPKIPRALALSMTAIIQILPDAALRTAAPYIKADASTLRHLAPTVFKMLCMGTRQNPENWIRYTGVEPSRLSEVYDAWYEGPDVYAALYARKRHRNRPKKTENCSLPAANITNQKRLAP